MTSLPVSIILDGLVILLLAGTIFYAARLSLHIKVFRDSRKDLEKLIGELSTSIEKAERAIGGLRENAKESGRDLQSLINEGQALSEELQIMNQSGNSLAGKLEKLADKNVRTSKAPGRSAGKSSRGAAGFDLPPREKKNPVPNRPLSGFAIHDSEFENDSEDDMDEEGLMGGDYEEDSSPDKFSSRAERELYEALSKKTRTGAGGVS